MIVKRCILILLTTLVFFPMTSLVTSPVLQAQRPSYPSNILGYDVYYKNVKSKKEYYSGFYESYANAVRAVNKLNEDPNLLAWRIARYKKQN